jgi:hypothetical protein
MIAVRELICNRNSREFTIHRSEQGWNEYDDDDDDDDE